MPVSIYLLPIYLTYCTAALWVPAVISFPFSGHEPIYFIENKEKTLRASYDRDTQIIDYMISDDSFLILGSSVIILGD